MRRLAAAQTGCELLIRPLKYGDGISSQADRVKNEDVAPPLAWPRLSLHPAFARLRATMPSVLNAETSPAEAARLIANGISRRASRIWVPGWVRVLHVLRAALHTRVAERELLKAAPDIERLCAEGLVTSGSAASSFGPRELEREAGRGRDCRQLAPRPSVVELRASLKAQNSPSFVGAHTHAMRPRIHIESSVIGYLPGLDRYHFL
jgi:hypothetical protein